MKKKQYIFLILLLATTIYPYFRFFIIPSVVKFQNNIDYPSEINDDALDTYCGLGRISSLKISNDATYFAASSDKKLYFFEKGNISQKWNYPQNCEGTCFMGYQSIAITPNGSSIAALSLFSNFYYFTNTNNPSKLFNKNYWNPPDDFEYILEEVDISSDGKYIAVRGKSLSRDPRGILMVFNNSLDIPIWTYDSNNSIESVAISSDGNFIVAGGIDHKIYLFSKNSSTPLWIYKTQGIVRDVAISCKGIYIAAGGDDRKVFLFNKNDSTPLWNYTSRGRIDSLSISYDGKYIIAGQHYQNAYFFTRDDSKPKWIYKYPSYIKKVSLSRDGMYIAIAYTKSIVYLNYASNDSIWTFTTKDHFKDIDMTLKGDYVIAGSSEGRLYLIHSSYRPPLRYEYTMLIIAGVYILILTGITLAVKEFRELKKHNELMNKENKAR